MGGMEVNLRYVESERKISLRTTGKLNVMKNILSMEI